jgi:hypothetical protein
VCEKYHTGVRFLHIKKSHLICIINDGLYADDGFNSLEILSLMSYTKYTIEIANPRGDKYYITINELFLQILCFIAEKLTAPQIKQKLEEQKIVKAQITIEGYIQQMKTEMFQLKLPGQNKKVGKDALGVAAIKFGLIAKRGDKHIVIIEETIASQKQMKLFDLDSI